MSAYETLLRVLEEREVTYNEPTSFNEGGNLNFFTSGVRGTYRVFVSVDTEVELFQVFCYLPLRFQNNIAQIAEVTIRANLGLRVGKFELDLEDGAVRFHVYQILEDNNIAEETIDRMVTTALAMAERYLPAFLNVHCGGQAKTAVMDVEVAARSGLENEEEDTEALLRRAIEAEDYEKAALLRDQLAQKKN